MKTIILTLIILSISKISSANYIVNVDLNIGDLYGIGYSSKIYDDFYNSLPTVISFRVSTPPSSTSVDLYLMWPRQVYDTGDASPINSYLRNGGRVVMISEYGGNSTYQNDILEFIGSTIRFDGTTLDGGGHKNSLSGQILDDTFTHNVDVLNYGAATSVSGGTPIFLASNLSSPLISYEYIGDGVLIAIGDSNFVDDLLAGSSDNNQLFENFLFSPIPEPSSVCMILLGGGILYSRRKRMKRDLIKLTKVETPFSDRF